MNKLFNNITIISTTNDHSNIENQLKQFENINYTIYDCFDNELNKNAFNLFNIANLLDDSIQTSFDLSLLFAYYNIINNALQNDLDHILIFEDNFKLLKKEYIDDFLDNIPYDFDIIQFSTIDIDNVLEKNNFFIDAVDDKKYFIETKYNFMSNNGLALSKNGMQFFVDTINHKIMHPYLPIYKSNKKILKHYISTVPIVYLENVDEISYNNIYSKLNKELYNL